MRPEIDIRAGLARDRHSSATHGSSTSAADSQRMILAKEKSAEPDKPALSAVSNRGETRILERFPKRVLSPHFHPKECICIEPRVDPLGFRRRLLRWKSTKALNSASLRGSKAANSTQVAMSALVISRHCGMFERCPLYPRKRTLAECIQISNALPRPGSEPRPIFRRGTIQRPPAARPGCR